MAAFTQQFNNAKQQAFRQTFQISFHHWCKNQWRSEDWKDFKLTYQMGNEL
jgi:hypothetical protein